MNFHTNFLFKPFLSGSLKPNKHIPIAAARPALIGSTLSRRDLRRLVAEMID